MKHILKKILVVTFFVLLAQIGIAQSTVFAKDWGILPSTNDCTPAVVECIEYCKKNKVSTLIFEKGTYHFYPDYGMDKYVFASNNDEGLRRIVFLMEEMKNFTIEGNGADFIFHNMINPFVVSNCENITFKNFSIDFSRTFHNEVHILEVEDKYMDVYIPESFPYIIKNRILIFVNDKNDKPLQSVYPDQSIYIPASRSGIYTVDNVTADNQPFKFKLSGDNLIIPIGVYRAGINNESDIKVTVSTDIDTLNHLLQNGNLMINGINPEILPTDQFEFEKIITIKDGDELENINLEINLPFLLSNLDKRYVTAITINSTDVMVNNTLKTIVVLLNTSLLNTTPMFTYTVDSKDSTLVRFTNTSQYALKYEWDFGDGSPKYVGITPPPHKYPSLGIFNVNLTASGATNTPITYNGVVHLWENITKLYIPNSGNPFLRSDNRTNKTGNLLDWSATSNVFSSSGYGGYYYDTIGVMDFFSTLGLKNAKIYKTFQLPNGHYKAGFDFYKFRGTNDCYFVVAKGNELPDIENIPNNPNVLGVYHWNTDIGPIRNEFEFELDQTQNITFGFVVTNTPRSEIMIRQVFLYK